MDALEHARQRSAERPAGCWTALAVTIARPALAGRHKVHPNHMTIPAGATLTGSLTDQTDDHLVIDHAWVDGVPIPAHIRFFDKTCWRAVQSQSAPFDEARLTKSRWSFGPIGEAPIITTLFFQNDGRIAGHRHPNQRFWRLQDGELHIFDHRGGLTWRFGPPTGDGPWSLTGIHAGNPNIRYALNEMPPVAAGVAAGEPVPAGAETAAPADDMVKLVIWDLDETFWSGTLAEGEITPIAANIELVRVLTTRGIVNSVCSKNDFARAEAELKKLGVWQYFVFPRIAFAPKGAMVRDIIQATQLRAPSVLFLDDNVTNLNEAAHYCPGLQTGEPSLIPSLLSDPRLRGKPDPAHKRLANYKVLEQKHTDRAETGTDNLEFLRQSEIRVSFHHDVLAEFPRIHDMVNRTNQLNFTKRRWPEDEAQARQVYAEEMELRFHSHAGYVKVADRYGNYGICGFYMVRAETCHHFLFSCRTLNMGIEQFVWHKLGRPDLDIVGEVVASLGDQPDWITVVDDVDAANGGGGTLTVKPVICVRGACDLAMMTHYLRTRFDTIEEFPFPYQGWRIMPSARIIALEDEIKTPAGAALIAKLPGIPPRRFESVINTGAADVYVLSFSSEIMSAHHRSRSTGIILPFNHESFAHDEYQNLPYADIAARGGGQNLTEAEWNFLRAEFEFQGVVIDSLLTEDIAKLLTKLAGKVVIVLMLNTRIGSERHLLDAFARVNDIVRPLAERFGCYTLEMNEFVRDVADLVKPTDGGVHYTRDVYMKLARRVTEIVAHDNAGGTAKNFLDAATPRAAPHAASLDEPRYQPHGPTAPIPDSPFTLLSAGRTATQSSRSRWSNGSEAEDATGALNGRISGDYNCHTAMEDSPWWMVDLGAVQDVWEIRIFNRISNAIVARRARRFDLLASTDGETWEVLVAKDDDSDVGGADGRPFMFASAEPIPARFIKIQLKGHTCLHLDQVQVFGDPSPPAPAVREPELAA